MLVIARKVGQTVRIGGDIEITVSAVRGDQVRLAIQAPRSVTILRKETVEQVELGNAAAVAAAGEWHHPLRGYPVDGTERRVTSDE